YQRDEESALGLRPGQDSRRRSRAPPRTSSPAPSRTSVAGSGTDVARMKLPLPRGSLPRSSHGGNRRCHSPPGSQARKLSTLKAPSEKPLASEFKNNSAPADCVVLSNRIDPRLSQ